MKKLLFLIVIIVIAISTYYFSLGRRNGSDLPSNSTVDQIDSKRETNSTDIIDLSKILKGDIGVGNLPSFTDSVSKIVVTFKLLTDEQHQTRNGTFEVYVDGKKAGEAGGESMISPAFSPDGKYFTFRVSSSCGSECTVLGLYVVDLSVPEVMYIPSPRKSTDYVGDLSKYQEKSASPFIESYSFSGNSLKIMFFFVATDRDNKIHRISPKEIWGYNLLTKQYILTSTLSD